MRRKYIVRATRAATFGVVSVSIPDEVISLRGEKQAVAQAAWYKLLGKNDLGEDIDKNLTTRKILMTEMLSRSVSDRPDVYQLFYDSITIHWVGVEYD